MLKVKVDVLLLFQLCDLALNKEKVERFKSSQCFGVVPIPARLPGNSGQFKEAAQIQHSVNIFLFFFLLLFTNSISSL